MGVLTVPKVIPKKPEERLEEEPPEEEPAPAADEALEDAEWLPSGELGEDDAPPPSVKEEAVAREAWTKWNELVSLDQEAWKNEAESHHLPTVEMVDWVFVEPVASKNTSEVLTAVGRMYAAARSEGFDVRRLHTDRGREYYNAAMRAWCARHGLHKTFALPEEHQSNGIGLKAPS